MYIYLYTLFRIKSYIYIENKSVLKPLLILFSDYKEHALK